MCYPPAHVIVLNVRLQRNRRFTKHPCKSPVFVKTHAFLFKLLVAFEVLFRGKIVPAGFSWDLAIVYSPRICIVMPIYLLERLETLRSLVCELPEHQIQ
jgi:hypothetical protein